jgi:GTPase SAR1 family protein
MTDEQRLIFFERLTALLNGAVNEKSEKIKRVELYCDALNWQITHLLEEIYKLDFLKDDFDLQSFTAGNIEAPIERMKIQMAKPWLNGKFTIGLMGHFNSGKTTALNLIFDENFATKHRENTALATYLTYGKATDSITIVDKGGKSQVIPISESEIFDYQKGVKNFPFARIFDYLVKDSNKEILKNLTFIDTPGLSSSNEHSEPTKLAISTCDAIFWFIALTDSEGLDDLDFIKNNLEGKSIYVVLSFADAVESLEESTKVIVKEFKKRNIEVKRFFTLGREEEFRSKFKNDVLSTLGHITKEHDIYNPYHHIYHVVTTFVDYLVDVQKSITGALNELKGNTNKILDTYRDSQNRYNSACSNCASRINNMADTFNRRCSSAIMCGGAANALASDFKSVVDSLNKMQTAYDAIDISKLVDYGHLLGQISDLEEKIKRSSEILQELKQIQKNLE